MHDKTPSPGNDPGLPNLPREKLEEQLVDMADAVDILKNLYDAWSVLQDALEQNDLPQLTPRFIRVRSAMSGIYEAVGGQVDKLRALSEVDGRTFARVCRRRWAEEDAS